jgi:hypothetical protein
MLSKQQFFTTLAILLCIIFFTGFWAGRTTKHCAEIVQEILTTDTLIQYVSSSPLTITSKPKVTVMEKPIMELITKYVDTGINVILIKRDTINISNGQWSAIDTLQNDSLFVAITDTGDCNGILTRHSVFGGKIKERTINNTILKVVQKPTPLFSLYAGIAVNGTIPFALKDMGPIATLGIKDAQLISLGYGLQQKQFTFHFQTKFK